MNDITINHAAIDLDTHLAEQRRNLKELARQDMGFDLDAFLDDYGIQREAARAARRERARVIARFLTASKRAMFGGGSDAKPAAPVGAGREPCVACG